MVALHSLGRFLSSEMPWLFGPRHCAQFDEPLEANVSNDIAAKAASKQMVKAGTENRFINLLSL